VAAALAAGATTGTGTGYFFVAAWLTACGAGIGLALSPAMDAVLDALPADRSATGTAITMTLRRTRLRCPPHPRPLRCRPHRRRRPGPGHGRPRPTRPGPYAGRARVGIADATDLHALVPEDGTYDAVFDFGIIHHIPTWRDTLAEVARVLTRRHLLLEEVTRHALDRPTYRALFDHPAHDRFTDTDFLAALDAHGLVVRGHRTIVFGDFLLGAADRTA
jgi:SAM-dependent methyltransferase